MKTYKDLKLEQEYIDLAIESWCQENLLSIISVKNLKKNSEQYIISDNILLNIYFKEKSVTLTPTGSNIQKGYTLADYIISNCLYNEKSTDTHFTLKLFSNNDFKNLVEYLHNDNKSDDDTTLKNKPICFYNSKLVGRYSTYKQQIYLTHYENGSFLLQGRHNIIFSQVIEFLSNNIDNTLIIKAQLDTFNDTTNINAQQSLDILENRIPNIYNHLPDELKILIAPIITLKSLNIELTEYSCLAFPLLKGVEGILKLLFIKADKLISNSGFSEYIENGQIKNNFIFHFNSLKMKEDIENMYKIYKKHRHPLFHIDGNITTTKLIEDREEMYQIIEEVFISINNIQYFKP